MTPATAARPHALLSYFLDAADGRFPPVDGGVTVIGPLPGGLECSVAFTGHAVIATALPADEVRRFGPDGFGASMAPDLLRQLAGPQGWIGVIDATLAAHGTGGTGRTGRTGGYGRGASPDLPPETPSRLAERTDLEDHPRVRLAREIRTHVRTYADERGLVTLAEGLGGRRELSVELLEQPRDSGARLGRSLLRSALCLVPEGEPVFAAVSPGNARSLRAFLAAGFRPVGSEVILRPDRRDRRDHPDRPDRRGLGPGT
jgi:hypothetical protein